VYSSLSFSSRKQYQQQSADFSSQSRSRYSADCQEVSALKRNPPPEKKARGRKVVFKFEKENGHAHESGHPFLKKLKKPGFPLSRE
jgi:hypothetical protein